MKFKDRDVLTREEILQCWIQGKRMNPVYMGYFLTETASKKLSRLLKRLYPPMEEDCLSELGHVTLQFAPSHPILFQRLLKEQTVLALPALTKVILDKLFIRPDHGISAFTVILDKKIQDIFPLVTPHITAFRKREVPPFHSNSLLANQRQDAIILSLEDIPKEKRTFTMHLGLFGNKLSTPQQLRQKIKNDEKYNQLQTFVSRTFLQPKK